MKKINQIKNMFTQKLISGNGNKGINHIPTVNDRASLKISEICSMLDMSIPKEYERKKNRHFTDTSLIEVLKSKDDISIETRGSEEFSEEYYSILKKEAIKFKKRYQVANVGDIIGEDIHLLKMYLEWQYVFKSRGFNFQDYFDYQLYARLTTEVEGYINKEFRDLITEATRTTGYVKYFLNKTLFNKKFCRFIHRDFLDMRKATFSEFEAFVNKHPKFFGKPIAGGGGRGAGILEASGDLEILYQDCKNGELIIEEIVKQHKEISSFNCGSLNTARIYTLLDKDNEPLVMLATIRFGRAGNTVDNLHGGGIGAQIDVETGIIKTNAIDIAGNVYENHPDSLKVIKGFKVPNWHKAIEAVKDAATMMPSVRHVGWDVAFTNDNGIEFMEGNTRPGFHIPQETDKIGKKHLYEKYIHDLKVKKEMEEEFEYDMIGDKVKIVSYKGSRSNLVVPHEICGKPVKIIGSQAFADLSFIESIKLPVYVDTIYRESFMNCKNLKMIEIPPLVTVVNKGAFKGCESLESVYFPSTLKRICMGTFKNCNSLSDVSYYTFKQYEPKDWRTKELKLKKGLPAQLEYIGEEAFEGCLQLEKG